MGCSNKADPKASSKQTSSGTAAENNNQPHRARRAAPRQAPRPRARPRPKFDAAKVPLEEIRGAKLGYTIQIPKGSKVLVKDESVHAYSFPFPDGMYEIHVKILEAVNVANLKDLVRYAKMSTNKGVLEQSVLPDKSLRVVMKSALSLEEVYHLRKGKALSLIAVCSAPGNLRPRMIEICASLKVTK